VSYLGPDREEIVEIKRYVFPEKALWDLEHFLKVTEAYWRQTLLDATHVIEISPLPLPVTDEEFEQMTQDDTEIM